MYSDPRTEASTIFSASSPKTRWRGRFGWFAAASAVVAACMFVRYYSGAEPVSAQAPPQRANRTARTKQAKPQAAGDRIPDPVATINGQDIRRRDLEEACVQRFGEEVLEGLVNKHLISLHCRNRDITVTTAEVDVEIERMAKRFRLSTEQFLSMLKNERGINLDEYRRDTIWAMLALRKLAADKLDPTEDELRRAYETQFGAKVHSRLIVVEDQRLARKLHAQLTADPGEFARLAMEYSTDVNSASIGGMIQPIRHYVGDPAIEKEVFQLQKGQISSIIRVGNQFAILKCEGHIQPTRTSLVEVQKDLTEQIKENKLRDVAKDLFARLQKSATVKNVYNDPTLRQTMPGVVATVNGDKISLRRLAAECLQRHGEEVLQIEISHTLLRQALRAAGKTVTDQDVQAEIQHAAMLAGVVDKAGNPDLRKWMKKATTDRGMPRDLYLRDSVWPSAALKKLASEQVRITGEDMQKAYDANYGERVRCRAIVMTNLRKAQQIWDAARKNPTAENFSQLAAEYSIEPTSSTLRGEIPPIRRNSGQPQIEKAAFALTAGQISGIIHIADKAVILYCEGRTQPIDLKMEDVQNILKRDLFEKKLRQVMAKQFGKLQQEARIDNFLAGTSQAPKRQQTAKQPRRDTAVHPAGGSARRR